MLGLWHNDLESLEAISQNDAAKRIFLRMAAMSLSSNLTVFRLATARATIESAGKVFAGVVRLRTSSRCLAR